MIYSSDTYKALKENITETIIRIGGWIISQLTTYIINYRIGSAISFFFVSILALKKFGVVIRIRKRTNFLEYVKNKIIELEIEIENVDNKISILKQAYKDERKELKRISVEEQLRIETNRLKELINIKLYFETLIRAVQVIEPLRHIHGNKVDEIYDKIIKLSIRAREGEIAEREVKEAIDKLGYLIDNVPEFPQILLEVIEEKLKD